MSGTALEGPAGGIGPQAPPPAIPIQPMSATGIAQPPSALVASALPVPPARRMAAELDWYWRVGAAVIGVATLAYAFMLAWYKTAQGVATAAAFAVALFALIFALAGVVPASVKVGDLEVKLQQAKEQGKEEGTEQGGLQGFKAAIAVAAGVRSGEVQPDDISQGLKAALMSDKPMEVRLPEATVRVPVPKLGDAKAAEAHAQEVATSLEAIA
jgi:hypothetical protein